MLVSLNRAACNLAIILIAVLAPAAHAADPRLDGVPVPLSIDPSTSDAPFAGSWFGRWGSEWRTLMVVERIKGQKVEAIYAVGPKGDYKGNWRDLKGSFDGDRLSLDGPGYTLDFEIRPSGRLRARYNWDQGFAIMSKGDLKTDRRWSFGSIEMLETDLVELGKPVRLEAVIYKPPGDGPFPLAVINHGSTGSGDNPAAFGFVFTNDWLADILIEHGWLVAFPQRRGRGGSDGLYDEGFTTDRTQYTCDAGRSLKGADRGLDDISAAVAALRRRPDVEASPVLIGGVSRGGILSVAWAGRNPDQTHGVVNFVGGWLGEGCGDAEAVNKTLFSEGGAYPRETLWLYGEDDVFYSLPYSRENFAVFQNAGGRGAFHEFKVNGSNNGHWVHVVPTLWNDLLIGYLDDLK